MPKTRHLDILILYNGNTACSAASRGKNSSLPFPRKSLNSACNDAYAYFLSYCRQLGLSAGFTTSKDIIGAGSASSYWVYQKNSWQKVNNPCESKIIFDKFSPHKLIDSSLQSLFFSKRSVKKYNSFRISDIFFDKHKTHTSLLTHTIPTIPVTSSSLTHIKKACALIDNLTKITNPQDFSTDYILKDQFGAGGWHVYRIKGLDKLKQIQTIVSQHKKISFILQPFALFDRGFIYQNKLVPTDIRLIYLEGTLFHSYLRFPKTGDYRCNEHQGGTSAYIKESEIPKNIRSKADLISSSLKTTSLIALDFIVTNNGTPYLVEGNTGPGLSWNENIKKEVYMGKKLIRAIVDQLATKSNANQNRFTINLEKSTKINHKILPLNESPITGYAKL